MRVLLLLLVLSPCATVIRGSELFSTVNWTAVTVTGSVEISSTVPRGCTCTQDPSTYSNGICQLFDCPCACDVTAGVCDATCCCDLECSAEHRLQVIESGSCDANTTNPSSDDYIQTYCTADLVAINPAYRMESNSSEDALLCIMVDNNDPSNEYVVAPTYDSVTEAFAAKVSATPSYLTNIPDPDLPKISTYKFDDVIKAVRSDGTSFINAFEDGSLPVKQATRTSSECTTLSATFGNPSNPSQGCIHSITSPTTLEDACSSLGMAEYTSNLYVAVAPDALSSVADNAADYVAVTVSSLSEEDAVTGAVSTLDVTPTYATVPEFTTGTCRGVLNEIEYVVTHTNAGAISSVAANVVIGSTSATAFSQLFKTSFINSELVSTTSAESNNLISFERSGNPGYIESKPIRVGKLETDSASSATAISELQGGLKLTASSRECEASVKSTLPVYFNQDTRTSCGIPMTSSELETYCSSAATATSVPPALALSATHVATFGSSDPLRSSEWIELAASTPFVASATYSRETRTCSDVVTAVNIEFLVGQVGAKANPQSKILSARISYIKDKWVASDSASKLFQLTSSVRFIPVAAEATAQNQPSLPPVWFAQSGDILYPFTDMGAATRTSGMTLSNVVTLLLVVVFNLYYICL